MPLSNVGISVDWGYLPIGYFGVDERFGKRSDFQAFVYLCHQHGIAVIVDVVYGHTGVDFPYYDAYTRLQYHENPFMGPFAKDYFSNFGKSTDFTRELTRDFFLTVFFFQAEDGIRDLYVTGVQTCALPICTRRGSPPSRPRRPPSCRCRAR